MYCASLIENLDQAQSALVRLVRALHADYRYEVDAPGCVEVTLFRQPDRHRHVLSLLNFQRELPNLPIAGIRVKLKLDDPIAAIKEIPSGRVIKHTQAEGAIELETPRLQTLMMMEVLWE